MPLLTSKFKISHFNSTCQHWMVWLICLKMRLFQLLFPWRYVFQGFRKVCHKKFPKNGYIKGKDFIPECLVSGRAVWWSSSLFKFLCIQGKIYLKGDGWLSKILDIYSTYFNNRTVWNSGTGGKISWK